MSELPDLPELYPPAMVGRREPRGLSPEAAGGVEIVCEGTRHRVRTARIELRAFQPDDANALLHTIDADVCRWQGWTGLPIEPLAEAMCAPDLDARLNYARLAIVDRASGDLIGARSWQMIEGRPDACDTGNWLAASARGAGYGTAELRAFLVFAHRHLGFETVRAQTNRRNTAARRQYEAAGFEVYTRREFRRLPNGTKAYGRGYRHRDDRSEEACHVGTDALPLLRLDQAGREGPDLP